MTILVGIALCIYTHMYGFTRIRFIYVCVCMCLYNTHTYINIKFSICLSQFFLYSGILWRSLHEYICMCLGVCVCVFKKMGLYHTYILLFSLCCILWNLPESAGILILFKEVFFFFFSWIDVDSIFSHSSIYGNFCFAIYVIRWIMFNKSLLVRWSSLIY